MCRRKNNRLFNHSEESYDGDFKADLVEQYKLYVHSADNVSARRLASSRYLLTLNVALVALYGFDVPHFDQNYWIWAVPSIGALASVLWFVILRSHAEMNRVKFELISEIERHLPASLYSHEWQLLVNGSQQKYQPVSTVEQYIPFGFTASHLILSVIIALTN